MPEPFRIRSGIVAPMDRANVDTDQILPKQFLKRIERTGFGPFLFYDWAHLPDGNKNPDFVLNKARYQQATILATGANFGCGSSREHAPWALLDYGFRAILAPSFADIFATNCFMNGLLTVALCEREVRAILRRAENADQYRLTIDLERCVVQDQEGLSFRFAIDPFRRDCLLRGLDEIALTLEHEPAIANYEATANCVFPPALTPDTEHESAADRAAAFPLTQGEKLQSSCGHKA